MAELLAIGLRVLRISYEILRIFVFQDFGHFYFDLDPEKNIIKQNNAGATGLWTCADSETTLTYDTGRPKILRISYGFLRVVGGRGPQNF